MKPIQSEITVKQIKELIERHVTIEEGPYGWGGPTEMLGHTDKAAKEIIKLIHPEYEDGGFWG